MLFKVSDGGGWPCGSEGDKIWAYLGLYLKVEPRMCAIALDVGGLKRDDLKMALSFGSKLEQLGDTY